MSHEQRRRRVPNETIYYDEQRFCFGFYFFSPITDTVCALLLCMHTIIMLSTEDSNKNLIASDNVHLLALQIRLTAKTQHNQDNI